MDESKYFNDLEALRSMRAYLVDSEAPPEDRRAAIFTTMELRAGRLPAPEKRTALIQAALRNGWEDWAWWITK